jgi:hypothetical protein
MVVMVAVDVEEVKVVVVDDLLQTLAELISALSRMHCYISELEQPATSIVRLETLLATKVVDTRSTPPSTIVATPSTM